MLTAEQVLTGYQLITKPSRTYPFYDLHSDGMPLPGPDFMDEAVRLGDKEPFIEKSGSVRRLTEYGPILEDLYYRALYDRGFSLKISSSGRFHTPTFIRGHKWGFDVTGPRPSDVMIVGKWPGLDDIKANRNMVGVSGQLTMRAFEQAGVSKNTYDHWYITNVIKFPSLNPASQTVAKSWIKDCSILLEQEIRIVRPKFILALGKEASKALIDEDFKFDLSQGQVFTRRYKISPDNLPPVYHEVKIMASLNPAFVARAADRMPEFTATVGRFVSLVNGQDFHAPEERVDHRVITTSRELKELVDDIIKSENPDDGQPIIAIDCEWHGEYPTESGSYLRTIQFSHKPGFAACVVLRRKGGEEAFVPSIEHAIPELKRLLVNTDRRKVRIGGHHLRADLPWIILGLDREFGEALLSQYSGPATPELTRTEGGFDSMLAAHAVTEAPGKQGFKLEILALGVCGIRRYDVELQKWKKEYCKANKLKDEELEGYGEVPDETLYKYANWDADATRRLIDAYNKPGGLLDSDQYGNNSREAFWEAMCAAPAVLEMEMTGLMLDRKRGEELTEIYTAAKRDLETKLRDLANWPDFNPRSSPQCRTLLFGADRAGVINKATGEIKDISPADAIKLNLKPIKTSGKPSKPWERVESRHEEHLYNPSADKEVLGILRMQLGEKVAADKGNAEKQRAYDISEALRNIRFAGQVIQSVLRPPILDDKTGLPELDEDGNQIFEKGLLYSLLEDGRVHTHIFQTKETGRFSSARPALQNISKRRESDYQQILGNRYKYALRSMIIATPGYALVEADYLGAELFMMAIQAGDEAMIDHCTRSALKESDPRFYDIHSNVAVKAFKLNCLPMKDGLKSIGKSNLRTAAKTLAFGIPYGRGTEAVIRAVEEEGVKITVQEADIIRQAIFDQYPMLEPFLEGCKRCVNNPGWMRNCLGRYRRFQYTGVADGGDMERQSMNFLIQSGVASAVNRALANLYNRKDRYTPDGRLKYRFVLQMHDAIIFEVLIPYLEWFVGDPHGGGGIIDWGMTDAVEIKKADLRGNVIPHSPSYHMGIEKAVMLNWGEKIPSAKGQELGIPDIYCAKPKK